MITHTNFDYEPLDSVRSFKQRNRLGQFKEKSPEEIQQEKERAQMEETAAKAITVGSRCEVTVSNAPPKRGVVMFVGMVFNPLTLLKKTVKFSAEFSWENVKVYTVFQAESTALTLQMLRRMTFLFQRGIIIQNAYLYI